MNTARSDQSQGGSTNQALFLSEAPYWENGGDQVSALFDSVARVSGTIIILENTAKGKDQLFYENYRMGLTDNSDWISIFVPWYWQEEYSIALKSGEMFEPTPSEQLLIVQYGLSPEQLKWRRTKLREYRRADSLSEFRREYPSCADDCFCDRVVSSFFAIGRVKESMANQPFDCSGENLYVGVDIGAGGDPSVACFRQGANVSSFMEFSSHMLLRTEEWIEKLVRTDCLRRLYVDSGGARLGIAQPLARKYGGIVRGINFGERPDDSETYGSKRAAMFDRVRTFFEGNVISLCPTEQRVGEMQVVIALPDRPKLTVIGKEDIMKMIGRSMDDLDALALTFAEDVAYGGHGGSECPTVVFLPRREPAMCQLDEPCYRAPGAIFYDKNICNSPHIL
jgi:hypothetical protein